MQNLTEYYSSDEFENLFTYSGDDLGATYSKDYTVFRLWAPTAAKVNLSLYKSGNIHDDDIISVFKMQPSVSGTWIYAVDGDLNGIYYEYTVVFADGSQNSAIDPYAKACGVNGNRAMVIDMELTNPEGWENDKNPHASLKKNDCIIYEAHIRDFTMDKNSGICNKGKFLGFAQKNTHTKSGFKTGLDHIISLGITHLQLLPIFDFGSIDEEQLSNQTYNWGYDPVNFFLPDGSYSTDPYDGQVRIKELKQLVKTLHDNKISIVMDVVFNHVYDAHSFSVNKIVPGYFSRIDKNGVYSNGSGCGNDTASERSMVRKFITDCVLYWAEEYHIDGFRFDLAGLIDTKTINNLTQKLKELRPDILLYGEGWIMESRMTKDGFPFASQQNIDLLDDFAMFNDNFRDSIKGDNFNSAKRGFISGMSGFEENISDGFMGLSKPWCMSPDRSINHVSCHDNLTLFDKISSSNPDTTDEEKIRLVKLAALIYLTSQGMPFIYSGEELLRSKKDLSGNFVHNSYSSPDYVNALKWSYLETPEVQSLLEYYKNLIAFRKKHPILRLDSSELSKEIICPYENMPPCTACFHLKGFRFFGEELAVMFNGNQTDVQIHLPDGSWSLYINFEIASLEPVSKNCSGLYTVPAHSGAVFGRTKI